MSWSVADRRNRDKPIKSQLPRLVLLAQLSLLAELHFPCVLEGHGLFRVVILPVEALLPPRHAPAVPVYLITGTHLDHRLTSRLALFADTELAYETFKETELLVVA